MDGSSNEIDRIDRLVKKLETLPTLPTVATKILSLSEDSLSASEEITNVISHDQALTAKLLKLVNSSFFGFSGKIKTIKHAVVILGLNDVKNIALASSTFEVFSSQTTIKKLGDSLWHHSAASATISRTIADSLGLKDKNDYFVCGLLHNIGMLLLAVKIPDVTEDIIKMTDGNIKEIRKSEEDLLGVNHSVIGGRLAQQWETT